MASPLDGKYFLDGMDLWKVFGLAIESGSDGFLKAPDRKDSTTHDWQDANGIDIDTSKVFFKSRDITLRVGIVANDSTDFWQKHNAFLAQIAKSYYRRLSITEFGKSYFVIYKQMTDYERFTKIGGNKIGCKFTIVLTEPEPDINYNDAFIADEEGRFIIT